ncbi:MAG: glycosyltransferase family 2 protein [Deltaproteobacteria bacterium]|nr:glycosyltransferase family 2 protein [Deltaproteobacteria bacterium]
MTEFQIIHKSQEPDLEILICTHNRARLLSRTLAFLNQAARPNGWRIWIRVVVNACTDETTSILRSYETQACAKGWIALYWIEEPMPGKSNALNRVIPLLSAPVIAFVDDDHRIDANYLVGIQDAVQAYPDAALFCGRILPDWNGTEPAWIHDRGCFRIYPLPVPRFDQGDEPRKILSKGPIPGGGNLFMRHMVFQKVGGFLPDFGPVGHNLGGAEDLQWVGRSLRLGLQLQYVPGVVQYHYVDPARLAMPYLMRKAYERSASAVRLSEDVKRRSGIPIYLARKIADYLLRSVFSIGNTSKRRFYLVRLAASMGEIKGFLQARNDRRGQTVRNLSTL